MANYEISNTAPDIPYFIKIRKMKKGRLMRKYAGLFRQLNYETQKHSVRVASICAYIAEKLNMNQTLLYTIGYVHDIGKLYIPSRIIKKSEALTPLERDIIDMHSYYGYRMLKEEGESPSVYIPVLFHHGFMKPRIGDEKSVITEEMMNAIYVIHSADVYDAMLSKRVYHAPFTKDVVMSELSRDALCSKEIFECLYGMNDLYRKQIIA